jgi:transcription termination factor Rho
MSSVLDPAELAASPLADLHLLANEIGVDGFRRMRKAELVDAILIAQGGEPAPPAPAIDATDVSGAPARDETAAGSDDDDDRPRRRSRGGRSRSRRATVETEEATAAGDEAEAVEEEDRPRRRSRGSRTPRPEAAETPAPEAGADKVVEGTIELMANGSAFIRVAPEAGGDDVYVSAAQVKRTELVSGDTVAGPIRPPRRSERHPSLIRVDSINGKPADEVSEGVRFEDLPATYPTERFELGTRIRRSRRSSG